MVVKDSRGPGVDQRKCGVVWVLDSEVVVTKNRRKCGAESEHVTPRSLGTVTRE